MKKKMDEDEDTEESEEEKAPLNKKRKREMPRKETKENTEDEGQKRSHDKKTKCRFPGCSFNGGDIRRHLKTHVKKGDLEEENLDQMVEVFRHGNRKRGPISRPTNRRSHSARRLKYWCPIPGCTSIVTYLYKHLQNVHGLKKDSVQSRVHRKSARRYAGMEERGA